MQSASKAKIFLLGGSWRLRSLQAKGSSGRVPFFLSRELYCGAVLFLRITPNTGSPKLVRFFFFDVDAFVSGPG